MRYAYFVFSGFVYHTNAKCNFTVSLIGIYRLTIKIYNAKFPIGSVNIHHSHFAAAVQLSNRINTTSEI